MNAEKLRRLQAQVRIGGKGTPRRKKKVMHQSAATDDKKLQSSLKKLSVSTIPGIEEVNIIKDDLTVIHFNNPKAQASLSANTFAVTGHGETKKIVEMLPEILPQLGQDTVMQLRMFANTMSSTQKQSNTGIAALDNVAEEDDVPQLVNDFEEVAKIEESSTAKPKSEEPTKKKENGVLTENNTHRVDATKDANAKFDKKSKKQQNKQQQSANGAAKNKPETAKNENKQKKQAKNEKSNKPQKPHAMPEKEINVAEKKQNETAKLISNVEAIKLEVKPQVDIKLMQKEELVDKQPIKEKIKKEEVNPQEKLIENIQQKPAEQQKQQKVSKDGKQPVKESVKPKNEEKQHQPKSDEKADQNLKPIETKIEGAPTQAQVALQNVERPKPKQESSALKPTDKNKEKPSSQPIEQKAQTKVESTKPKETDKNKEPKFESAKPKAADKNKEPKVETAKPKETKQKEESIEQDKNQKSQENPQTQQSATQLIEQKPQPKEETAKPKQVKDIKSEETPLENKQETQDKNKEQQKSKDIAKPVAESKIYKMQETPKEALQKMEVATEKKDLSCEQQMATNDLNKISAEKKVENKQTNVMVPQPLISSSQEKKKEVVQPVTATAKTAEILVKPTLDKKKEEPQQSSNVTSPPVKTEEPIAKRIESLKTFPTEKKVENKQTDIMVPQPLITSSMEQKKEVSQPVRATADILVKPMLDKKEVEPQKSTKIILPPVITEDPIPEPIESKRTFSAENKQTDVMVQQPLIASSMEQKKEVPKSLGATSTSTEILIKPMLDKKEEERQQSTKITLPLVKPEEPITKPIESIKTISAEKKVENKLTNVMVPQPLITPSTEQKKEVPQPVAATADILINPILEKKEKEPPQLSKVTSPTVKTEESIAKPIEPLQIEAKHLVQEPILAKEKQQANNPKQQHKKEISIQSKTEPTAQPKESTTERGSTPQHHDKKGMGKPTEYTNILNSPTAETTKQSPTIDTPSPLAVTGDKPPASTSIDNKTPDSEKTNETEIQTQVMPATEIKSPDPIEIASIKQESAKNPSTPLVTATKKEDAKAKPTNAATAKSPNQANQAKPAKPSTKKSAGKTADKPTTPTKAASPQPKTQTTAADKPTTGTKPITPTKAASPQPKTPTTPTPKKTVTPPTTPIEAKIAEPTANAKVSAEKPATIDAPNKTAQIKTNQQKPASTGKAANPATTSGAKKTTTPKPEDKQTKQQSPTKQQSTTQQEQKKQSTPPKTTDNKAAKQLSTTSQSSQKTAQAKQVSPPKTLTTPQQKSQVQQQIAPHSAQQQQPKQQQQTIQPQQPTAQENNP